MNRKPALLFASFFLLLHCLSLWTFHSQTTRATYPFAILAPLLAVAACWIRSQTEGPRERLAWMLLGAGLMLWDCGMALSAWEELSAHIPFAIAWFSDVIFFLYGVPVLLAISSAKGEQRSTLFFWMDFRGSLCGEHTSTYLRLHVGADL